MQFMVLLGFVLVCEVCVAALMLSGKVNAKQSFDDFVLQQFENYYNNTIDDGFNETSFIDTTQKTVRYYLFTSLTV